MKMILSGRAYIKNGFRVVYNARKINKGKNKGKIEVYYRDRNGYRKKIISKIDLPEEGGED